MVVAALAYSYLRFSSAAQAKGDSFRRQIAARDAYVARKGLTLDTPLVFSDRGVSAYRGKNSKTGALKLFWSVAREGGCAAALRPTSRWRWPRRC